MAIRLRHDAAALGSNLSGGGGSNRKYGQQLVMQQRKYDMDQVNAMQDRAFDMQKQQMQNAWQANRDVMEAERENARMLKAAQINETARSREDARRAQQAMEARNLGLQDMERQSRVANFEQGRSSITSMAQNALQKGNLPVDLQKKISDLVVARTSVLMDPKWDEPQRQQFLQDYNSQLTALLGQVPPETPAYEQANQNLRYYDPRTGKYASTFEPGVGMEVYDPETKMRWQDPASQQRGPMTAQDYYRTNPDRFEKDLANEMSVLQEKVDSGEAKFFESEDAMRQAAWERMQNAYNFRQNTLGGGMPQAAQPMAPGASPGVSSSPAAKSVSPAVMQAVGNVLNTFPDTEMMAMSQLGREALVRNGFPQGQAQAPSQPPVTMPTDRAGMVAAGVPQGGAVAQQEAPSQNPWQEFVSPSQQQASVQKTESAAVPLEATASAPDFKKLSESATDSSDKLVLGRLQSMYGSQPLDIQRAISAFVDPGSSEEIAGQAIMYLKNKGIDILQLGKPARRKLPGMSQ